MNKPLSIIGADRQAARVAEAIGATPGSSALSTFLADLKQTAPHDVKDGIGTIGGLSVGAWYWKKHRVLGGIVGASLGRNVPALLRPAERNSAACNLGATAVAVAAARYFPKHPIIGFLGGLVASEAVIHATGLRK